MKYLMENKKIVSKLIKNSAQIFFFQLILQ